MKKKEKAYSIALVSTFIILFLIFVSSTASALQTETNPPNFTVPEITGGAEDPSDDKVVLNELSTEENNIAMESIQPAALKITEKRITTNKSEQSDPVIYGNKIVWSDNRNGNWDIYMYDLSTKKETQITTNVSDQYGPSIYGNRIVWVDMRNTNIDGYTDIYMYDLSTKKETQITNNEGYLCAPSIYGDKIVWISYPCGNLCDWCSLFMYDVSTKTEKIIPANGNSYSPAIYGNRIVWESWEFFNIFWDHQNLTLIPMTVDQHYSKSQEIIKNLDNWRDEYTEDIYMYDISTKKETQITANEYNQVDPAIYSNKIVWCDDRNGNWDIYMYDLSTKKETQITTSPSDSLYPAIYGNRIAWDDGRNGNRDIYVYDLDTGQEWHTTDKSDQYGPEIYGNRIVWTDMRKGNADIYMGTLSKSSPVAAFSASPTKGKAPLKVSFTDTSTGFPTSWFWNFGDGAKSFLQNPVHKYSKAGKYTVSLTVKNAAGRNTVTKKDYINVVTKPNAAFSSSSTSGKVPLKVKFTDKSTGTPAKWLWNFGDGSKSFHQNPVHKYSKAGTYTVSLTVKNAVGRNSVTKTKYITVAAKPVAAFSASSTSGKFPLKVQFTDKSTGSPTKWKWSFGDGTISTKQNPTHKYSKAGKYTVTFKVTNAVGINTVTKSKYITVT